MTTVVNPSGNPDIDGILWGYSWDTTALTYSFPTSAGAYAGYINGFEAFNAAQQAAITQILANAAAFSGLTFTLNPGADTHLRYAEATQIDESAADGYVLHVPGGSNNSAEANPPDPAYPTYAQGDNWFNHTSYNTPMPGSFAYAAGLMHETGHALGLKHGHATQVGHGVTFPTLPPDHDSQEYSIMTYRQYVGQPAAEISTSNAANNAQMFMQNDIAALQYMYGADYGTNAGDTTYKWQQTVGFTNSGELYINTVAQNLATGGHILMTIWDGGGVDTYDFSNYTTDLNVNLAPGEWTTASAAQLANLGSAGDPHLARGNIANALMFGGSFASLIENATGGTGNDFIQGNQAANTLSGGSGNDTLFGLDGSDRFEGGLGADTHGGGNGIDQAQYTFAVAGVTADLLNGGSAGDALGDTYFSVENLLGSSFDDVLRGDGGSNTLCGGAGGADTLDGRGGADALFGVTGDDTYRVDETQGIDTLSESVGEGRDRVLSSVRWVLGNNFEDLILTGSASVNGFGNAAVNTLTGNSGDNYLDGGAELDTLAGGAGSDNYALASTTVVNGANTWDTVTEGVGAGTDTVYASADVGRYTYQLTANVENLVATGTSVFRLWGNERNNFLTGNDAANEMAGFDGYDTFDGNGGLDILTGGAGNDIYIMEDVTFVDEFTGYVYDTVIEAEGGGRDGVYVTNVGTDYYYLDANVEDCAVFGAFGLAVYGNNIDNALFGAAGDDRLEAAGGNDTLNGGVGLDYLSGGDGDDHYVLDDATLVNGGYTWDTVSEAGSTGNDTVSASADVGRYTYQLGVNVENLVATGVSIFRLWGNELGNRLTGNAAANEMAGFDGNDTLQGGAGADTLEGGLGDDVFYVDTNADRVVENAGGGYDRVYASAFFSLSQVAEVEYLATANAAGTAGTDLTGSNTANTIVGDAGSNTLTGRGGADALIGGAGSDFASYVGAAAVIASLANPAINTGDAAGDTYNSIENLIGSNFNDALNGDNGVNDIRGGVGSDALKGYAGNDILYGQDDNDTLIGGVGGDYLSGSAGFDTTSYAGATARVIVSLANSSINAGDAAGDSYVSIENLTGSSFNDTLNGDNSANVVNGGAGNDFIKGYGGNDTLTGGAGGDTFIFNTALAAATNVDAITDFSVADDTIQLDDAIFAAIAATGALLSGYFRANATGTAQDSNDHIVYETDTGKLFYDANGNGAGAAIQFATLAGNPTITAADFLVI